ncbi:ATP-dependent RNA helicase HrpA [Longispora fulva]|uniref:RNA helicase n=1 Tax=Longispora fulva TaxID=619741 RepID=A0A8J7GD88_9ACTN|nr:ATP-dependent RNA helicase HrpA [Longispora fulva]MBG6138408.1 ATP-dependent helicase HrpA [Longispora fulva]
MGTPPETPRPADLLKRLPELMLGDQRRLGRRLDAARRDQGRLPQIAADLATAEERVARRRAAVPTITYPEALPVSQKKDDLLAAIRDHQVVIVAGETGSGKTTQLPKICLELGRGVRGLIGHTQPRRLAARTVADRIAEELGTELGGAIGFKVRFTDHVRDTTLVKLMTDGILLAELQNDRKLEQYDTLIIDEAHERSLNIDFILGYLKQLLPQRPDLKVIITSATIDPERFAAHFDDAPIIEVSGRTFPVEVRYNPIEDEDSDQTSAIADAVEELQAEGPGDILVFLSGEREIRDTADALNKLKLRGTEVLPLYARLSVAEQHRVFAPHAGRRVVLATNVAETSLTVPGIKYVIDPGTARISRYSHRLKVQRLPIEAVSQASANQRKGRCGRTSDGICIRLYSEEDFESRPEFTDPEILRTNLASVILQMTSIGLGDIAAFPFLEPPDKRNIADGVQLLEELGALDGDGLTPMGRKLAQLPVDPRLARMVIEADKHGCVSEVMVIAAALSIQDPRERPAEHQMAATEKHSRFVDKSSDFASFLALWKYLLEQQKELSSNQFRRMCRTEFLNYLRVREWQDIYSQLRQVAKTLNLPLNTAPAAAQGIHLSLLSGLLSHIGLFDAAKREYTGARGAKFSIFPGSALFKTPPRWVMSAELVETSKLWGRINAKIEPEWVEPLAPHLVKRSYSEPHWEKKQAAVMAYEKVTLYGVPIVAQRKVNYGRIAPSVARELFIRHALVEGDWNTHHAFFQENRDLLEEVEELENRARRRDILVDDETLYQFYGERVAKECVSGRHFDSWWKKTKREQPDLLSFSKAMLINEGRGALSPTDYPDVIDGMALTYQFEPGADADGVTVHVPLGRLSTLTAGIFDWQIPGLRQDLVTALIKSLPKVVRRNFVPAPDYAAAALERLTPGTEPLLDGLERELRRYSGGHQIGRADWDLSRVPDHLKITYRVLDDKGATLAEGKDLAALQQQLKPKVQQELATAGSSIERRGVRSWDLGDLPQVIQRNLGGYPVSAYPALVDAGDSVAVKVFENQAEAAAAMVVGTRRLLLLTISSPVKPVLARLSNQAKLALSRYPGGRATDMFDDCASCAVDALVEQAGGPAWTADGFAKLRDHVRGSLSDVVYNVITHVQLVLAAAHTVEGRLKAPADLGALADMRRQLSGLVFPGFVAAAGGRQVPHLPRYLKGIEQRLDKLPTNGARDKQWTASVQEVEAEYRQLVTEVPPSPELTRIRWMIEELRVSYFAQSLGTAYPVSEKRIYKAMDEL